MRAQQSLQTQENIDLPAAMRLQLSSESTNIVRQALLDNIVLLRPYLCYWPWIWPYFYRCDEVAVIYTDNNGRFDTTIYYPCLGDHPDLYFWVEYCIGGAWTAVYVQSCFKKQGADFPIMLPSLLNFMLAAALF